MTLAGRGPAETWPCLFSLWYQSLTPDPPRNDWPAMGQPSFPTLHFYQQGPVPAQAHNPSLFATGLWASPAPNLHFYRQG